MARLLYLVSEDWYFLSHRLPMARAARDAGYEVHVATRVVDGAPRIESEGFVLHPIDWRRGSINPLVALSTILAVRHLYRQLMPDIVHHVAFAPSIIGSIAALGLGMAKLNALAGLGYVFTSDSTKARMLRPLARSLLRFLLQRHGTAVLVQNPDDEAMVADLGVSRDRIARIAGSGVDVDRLTPMPEPHGPFAIGFVGRLLSDKGVEVLVRAQELLAARGRSVRVLLAGTPDPSNPASIREETLAAWRRREGLVLLGHVDDVAAVWAQAHVAVLPSRREGLPLSLLEAAACGRPLIATDVPGCREIVRPDIDGTLVPPDNAEALAQAIERLMGDRALRERWGKAARAIVVDEFSEGRVGKEIVMLYARLLSDPLAPRLKTMRAPSCSG
jgi:glycosyltransferase involved in cell wall biosynthesis